MPASGLLASLVATPGSSCTTKAAAASPFRRRVCSGLTLDTPTEFPLSSRCTTAALLTMLYMHSANRVWTGVAGGGPT